MQPRQGPAAKKQRRRRPAPTPGRRAASRTCAWRCTSACASWLRTSTGWRPAHAGASHMPKPAPGHTKLALPCLLASWHRALINLLLMLKHLANQICREQKRHTYTTPTSYLQLLQTYRELLASKRRRIDQQRARCVRRPTSCTAATGAGKLEQAKPFKNSKCVMRRHLLRLKVRGRALQAAGGGG